MRVGAAAFALMGLWAAPVSGQSPPLAGGPGARPPAPVVDTTPQASWEFSASAYIYVLPDEGNYAQPTVTADRGWLHLEARFNYEDRDTGSLWAGYTVGGGDAVTWELTPVVGAVFGNTSGVAPGYKGSLGWRALEFYSEGEYVITSEASERFFYSWSELTVSPVEWFRAGLVTQRTRAYQQDRDIDRGVLVGVALKRVQASIYVLNPDDGSPATIVAVALAF